MSDNEHVALTLTGRDVDNLQRLLSLLLEASVKGAPAHDGPSHRALVAQAKRILETRNRRLAHFGKALVGEPAWDMLLILYVAATGQRQTVARLIEMSGASRSTAIRWIEYLEDQKLIGREPHPTDRRTDFVKLTDNGKRKLETFLTETISNSL